MLNVQKESANLLKHSAAVWSCRCLRDPAPHAVDDLHKKKKERKETRNCTQLCENHIQSIIVTLQRHRKGIMSPGNVLFANS